MNVNMDFQGGVKFIWDKEVHEEDAQIKHILLLFGCKTFVAHSVSEAGIIFKRELNKQVIALNVRPKQPALKHTTDPLAEELEALAEEGTDAPIR